MHTLAALAEARGEEPAELGRRSTANATARVRAPVTRADARRSELGQHFLADENILGVIGRLAELDPDDVVLEVGPGLGVLTRYLADRVAHVHAVELDRSLEPQLRERSPGATNVELAVRRRAPLAARRARPAAREARREPPLQRRDAARRREPRRPARRSSCWCVMVQREVADRFFAAPGTKSYGAVSVLVQLTAERTGFHPVSRTVFRPPPNVDSALVAFRRRRDWGPEYPGSSASSQAAFAHRRKTLANSLELAGSRAETAAEARARARLGIARRHPGRGARAGRSSSRSPEALA